MFGTLSVFPQRMKSKGKGVGTPPTPKNKGNTDSYIEFQGGAILYMRVKSLFLRILGVKNPQVGVFRNTWLGLVLWISLFGGC